MRIEPRGSAVRIIDQKAARALSLEDFLRTLQTSPEGLLTKEAESRLHEYGPNLLARSKVRMFAVLGRQFTSSLVYLLAAASALAYAIGDRTDGSIIFIILLINTSLGFAQEYRSERTVEKLQHFITRMVRVKRDGDMVLVDEQQIVPGDILQLREGDIVPADLRLLEADALAVDESQLTGESVPVNKRAAVEAGANAECLLYTGSVIERGVGMGVVYATGGDTEYGAIARLTGETRKRTPYEEALRSFSSLLIQIVLGGLVLVFAAKIIIVHGTVHLTLLLLFIIALAVSTVPEALPVITTVALSSGALKLAKRHVVVKRLAAIEDLGNVNLLCTDKTGTITENKMSIQHITSSDERQFETFAYAAITPMKTHKRRSHNAYDDAFIAYVPAAAKEEAKRLRIVKELSFDPEARRNRIVFEDAKNGKHFLVAIGAPEALLSIAPTPERTRYLHALAAEGAHGLHHLAIAYKEINYEEDFDILANEHRLTFLGYASFLDPLRPTAKATVLRAEKLGIAVKLLTGDSREVAQYAGREIGLLAPDAKVYLGEELDGLTAEAFKEAVESSNVFARVTPTQKYKIIETLKEHHVVGYQGDGINDAPALKLADVAIAVNSATDIAKESADIVLLNRSLETIVDGIRYGRSLFVNINKYIRYTMSNNFGVFIGLSTLFLLSVNLPILPVQALLNNLLADIPLILVSTDTVEDDEIHRPAQHNVRELITLSLILGIPTALFEIFFFLLVRTEPLAAVQTSLYLFLTFQALIVFYAVRTKKHLWRTRLPAFAINTAFLIAFVCSLALIYVRPFQTWFSFTPLGAGVLASVCLLMLAYLFAVDFVKVLYYRYHAHPVDEAGRVRG